MTADTPPTIAFVIPCYNEQAGLLHTLERLLADMDKLIAAHDISASSTSCSSTTAARTALGA